MKKIILSILIIGLIGFVGTITFAARPTTPPAGIAGKIIALDAGHGGTSFGAQYPANCANDGDDSDCLIYEKDVNLAVIYSLKSKLEASGANVVLTRECNEQSPSNKERATIASAKCAAVDVMGDGVADNKKCDVLLSVHHNGNIDPIHNGTLVIYNGKTDKKFATYMHDALIAKFKGLDPNWKDEGYLSGGYGITIFGNFVSALTEAYYITNTAEETANLAGVSSLVCDSDGDSVNDYSVLMGARTQQEVDAQYNGLVNYFSGI